MNFTQRSATYEDKVWLEPLYESLMKPYVEQSHEWDETLFDKYFEPEKVSIIQVDGKDIGMLTVEHLENHIYLGDIQIDEAYQGKGIGSNILKSLIKKAQQSTLPIKLKVLKVNPARNLYERFGFKLSEEQEYSIVLEYKV